MSSAFQQSAGRLRMVDPTTGAVIIDTDERMWIQTDWVSSTTIGQVVLPARNAHWAGGASYSPLDVTNDVAVTSVNGAATVVDGMMKVSAATNASSSYRPVGGGAKTNISTYGSGWYGKWFQCSGTLFGEQFGRPWNSTYWTGAGGLGTIQFRCALVAYTWIASGGTLTLRERVCADTLYGYPYGGTSPYRFDIDIPERTVDFRLFVGSFV